MKNNTQEKLFFFLFFLIIIIIEVAPQNIVVVFFIRIVWFLVGGAGAFHFLPNKIHTYTISCANGHIHSHAFIFKIGWFGDMYILFPIDFKTNKGVWWPNP